MSDLPPPPVPKYRLTLTVTGNSHDDIERELLIQTRGGYLLNSDGYRRDQWKSFSGCVTSQMEHLNPDMTPERYKAELMAWWEARRADRNAEARDTQPEGGERS